MKKSFALVILAALLCLSGCESVSQVPVDLGPESVSETVMLKRALPQWAKDGLQKAQEVREREKNPPKERGEAR